MVEQATFFSLEVEFKNMVMSMLIINPAKLQSHQVASSSQIVHGAVRRGQDCHGPLSAAVQLLRQPGELHQLDELAEPAVVLQDLDDVAARGQQDLDKGVHASGDETLIFEQPATWPTTMISK